MMNNKKHFDLSDYPKDHPLYCADNKKVIGKFINETSENLITEFVGLWLKQYCFKTDDGKEKKTCKRVWRNVVKREIKVDDYYTQTLYTHENKDITQNEIRTYAHEIYTETKVDLSCFDDKIWIHENDINCLITKGFVVLLNCCTVVHLYSCTVVLLYCCTVVVFITWYLG